MRHAARIVMLGLAFASLTAVLGWVAVPLLGGVWGIVSNREVSPAATAGISAALGWSFLLLWGLTTGPIHSVAAALGGVFGVPGAAVYLVTLSFPFLLAWCAAGAVSAVRRFGASPRLEAPLR